MAEPKTRSGGKSVSSFLQAIPDKDVGQDFRRLVHLRLLKTPGEFTSGYPWLYLESLAEVHRPTRRRLICPSVRHM